MIFINLDKLPAVSIFLYLLIYQLPLHFDVGVVVLILGGVFLLGSDKENFMSPPAINIPDLLIFFFIAIVAWHAINSPKKELSLVFVASFFPAILIYIILSRSKPVENCLKIIYYGIFSGAFFSSLVILIYKIKFWDIAPSLLIKKLPLSIFVVPNDFLLVSISIPFFIVLLILEEVKVKKVFFAVSIVVCLVAILITQSRSSIAVALIGGYAVLALHRRSFFVGYLFLVFLVFFAIGVIGDFDFVDKIRNYSLLCETRIPLWVAAWDLWSERMFLGHGTHSYVDFYQEKIRSASLPACSLVDQRLTPWPHNLYLELLSNYGLLGAVPFFVLVVWSLVVTYKAIKNKIHSIRLLAIGNFGALVGLFFSALVELTLVRYWVVVLLFTVFGISVVLNIMNQSGWRNQSEENSNW